MFICPKCTVPLAKTKGPHGIIWRCPSCDGRSGTLAQLRRDIPAPVVKRLWQLAKSRVSCRARPCPACNTPMVEVPARGKHEAVCLDVCTVCQFVWFDPGEYAALPTIPRPPAAEKTLSPKAREKIALMEVDVIRQRSGQDDWSDDSPDAWWQWIPGALGLPVEHDAETVRSLPWVTWITASVISLVSVIAFFDLENAVENFGLVPAHSGRYAGLAFLTSFLLHGGVFHLLGNMYFLLIFGDNVEDWLGKWRFLFLLVCSTVVGDIAHIVGDPNSIVPCIGASGGISGIVAFYALKFPRVRLGFLVRISLWFRWVRVPTYVAFLIWVAIQLFGAWAQMAGLSNVSSLAHLGGASVGVVLWFVTREE